MTKAGLFRGKGGGWCEIYMYMKGEAAEEK